MTASPGQRRGPHNHGPPHEAARPPKEDSMKAVVAIGSLVITACVLAASPFGSTVALAARAPAFQPTAGGPLAGDAAPVASPSDSDRARLLSLLSDSVTSLSVQSDPSDPRYFSGGVWLSGQDDCFRCNTGPGVA